MPEIFATRCGSIDNSKQASMIEAVIESKARPEAAIYTLCARSQGKEVGRQDVRFPESPPYSTRVTLERVLMADELVFWAAKPKNSEPVELARQAIRLP